MKLIFKGIAIIAVVFSLSVVFVIGGMLHGWYSYKPAAKADCIIVLGCKVDGSVPSPFLTSRIEEALKLFNEGRASRIIASGGQGSGEEISEAEAIKRYLVEKGVPEHAVLLEDKSTSTWENLLNSKSIMDHRGLHSAIVVSNKFHLKRASMISAKLELQASFSGVYNKEHRMDEFGTFLREILATYKFYLTKL